MTLEAQYKQFLERNPESKFTFEEWKAWFAKQISEALKKLEDEKDKSV